MKKNFTQQLFTLQKQSKIYQTLMILILITIPVNLFGGVVSGTFATLANCPMNLTCFTVDPTNGYFYGQGDQGSTNYYRYNASTNTWSSMAACPQSSGNNGGATYLNGKIYNSYCTYNVITIYTIATNSWTSISGGLNAGSISTDGTDIYVSANNIFKKYIVSSETWVTLTGTSCQPWGGLQYKNGYFYLHTGNGTSGFKKYCVATDTWTDLADVPGGAVLGSAIFDAYYYCQGSYGGTNLYSYDLGAAEWNNSLTLPFTTDDAAIVTYNNSLYIVQGEAGTGFTRFSPTNPILTGIEASAINYTIGAGTTAVTSTILTSGGTYYESATISISNSYESGKDVLSYTDANGITGSWNSSTGILTFTGHASIASYQTALRSVLYSNSSFSSTTNTRKISIKVYNGTEYSNTQTRDILITIPPVPVLTTTAVSSIITVSANSGGNITNDGGTSVIERGICWNTSGSPTIADSKTSDGTGSGSYSSSITGLSAGTTYYVRAYATNSIGTGYGNQLSFTALRNSQTVSFSGLPAKTFGDGDFAPDASATSGLPVTFTSSNTGVATIVGSDIHIVSAGTSVITATQAGNSSWLPASANQTLSVNKCNQTITFDYLNTGDPKTYGSADFDPTATSSSGLTITYSSDNASVATIVSGKIHFAEAGTANITAIQAGNGNYNAATEVVQNLVVSKANLTATADNKSRVYGASNPVFTISYSGFVNSENESVIDSKPTASVTADVNSDAGDYTITTTGGNDNNYNISVFNATLTINKSHLTVTAENKNKVYGDANPQLTFLYSGFVNGENKAVLTTEPSISTSTDITTPVGEYSNVITLTGGVDENYDFTFVPADFIVTKAMLTVTANDKTKSYSESNPSLPVHYSGFVNGDDESVINIKPGSSTTALTLSDAGTYPIVAAGGSDNNYDFSYIDGTLTITKVPLTVTAESKSKIYGELNPALSFVYSGFVNDEDKTVLDEEPSISTTAFQNSDVGDYPITLSGGSDNNYDMILVDNNLSIGKATLVATAEDKTRIYGDAYPLLTSVLTGFVNGDDESVIDTKPQPSTTADIHSNTGSYVISIAGGVDNNYNFSYVPGTLIVSKSLLTVTADNKTKVYGSVNPGLKISYSGFKNNDNASVIDLLPVASTNALNTSNTGEYAITLAGGNDNNYDLTLVDGSLEISKAWIEITAENKTKVYGNANPALSIIYSGFVLGENQSVLDELPVIETAADLHSDAGEYDINVSAATDGNYLFEYKNGSLIIEKADQVITFDEIPAGLRMTQEHQLNATSSSGLPVRFETSDPNIGSLNSSILTVNKEGSLTITAMQDGDNNWNPATDIPRSIVTLPTFDNINSLFTPNHDGMNDTWYIPDLEQYGKLQVTVYNRYGQTVYRSDSYKNDWDGTWNGYPLPSASYYYIMKSSVKGTLKGVVNLVR